ncbi:hypothetical protein BO70DRAFT_193424 [Aspergillus heteromorphus CBS 117.55]|uniref:Uncharacterized protein n=1 Tax=Aspergillus heteromorphus CBS 117.55 TaxID=1448321 RepID=A0A317WMW7_9EURO|nr:uncharacterized protein BO70DRAFT_193424 [Aspergillus heteromorphus CBS 117.55]PWY87375.1 hypothetical protein BO70DRAFT_193424 [Aspergillus heteromorphus CBS 117.55]
MRTSLLASALSAWAAVTHVAASPLRPMGDLVKRSPDGNFSLYDYGVAARAVKLFYADGLAYFGTPSDWTYGSVVTDVTFTFSDGTISTAALTEGVTLPDETLLYIRPNADAVTAVGFTGDATPSDAVTDGWIWYGAWLMYEAASGTLEETFYVQETNVTGVWQLFWIPSGVSSSGYTAGNVRDIADS